MKIIYVLDNYTGTGGIERTISLKTNWLAAHGYDVGIVAIGHDPRKQPFFHFDERIRLYDLGLASRSTGRKNKRLFIDRLTALLEEIRPDITVAAGRRLLYSVCDASDGSKKVLESHFNKYGRKRTFSKLEQYAPGRWFLRLYYRNQHRKVKHFDCLVLLTEEDSRSWQKVGVESMVVIGNPLSFQPETLSELSHKRILAIGRHEHQKGFDQLIDIWRKMESEYPDWVLTIVGEGRKKERLEKQIAGYGIAQRVELLPPEKDILSRFRQSAVYVMTSNYEGQPMVLLESMVCGVPPVAYACKCGPRDLIEDGVGGFLVDPGDKNQFARKLKMLLDSPELRSHFGGEARESVRRFNIESIMSLWEVLFRRLAGC